MKKNDYDDSFKYYLIFINNIFNKRVNTLKYLNLKKYKLIMIFNKIYLSFNMIRTFYILIAIS